MSAGADDPAQNNDHPMNGDVSISHVLVTLERDGPTETSRERLQSDRSRTTVATSMRWTARSTGRCDSNAAIKITSTVNT